MDIESTVAALSALAQPTRLEVFRKLIAADPNGLPAGEVASQLKVPHNTMSSHLNILNHAGLVSSERRGRSIVYRVELDMVRNLFAYLLKDCCGGRPELCQPLVPTTSPPTANPPELPVADKTYNVLFLCTGNSARSILGEAILRQEGSEHFKALSAGSQPKGEVHPFARDLLKQLKYPTENLRSKSWNEFAVAGAPKLDFVITVCDNATHEVCPIWPGQPMTAHWGLPDPAAVEGSEAERRLAFAETYRMLRNRILAFISLPISSLDRLSLQNRLSDIGKS